MEIKEVNVKKMSDKEFERKRKSGRLIMFREDKAYDYDGNMLSRTQLWRDIKTKKQYKIKLKG